MEKPYRGPWVIRTFLFAPGHLQHMIDKAAESQSDCVALCLEDAVPHNEKCNARQSVKKALTDGLFSHKPVFARINPIDTGMTLLDLEEVACNELDGFVYPMAKTADDIKKFDAQLSLIEHKIGLEEGHFSVIVLIETPLAVINAYEIATASKRVVGIMFGCEDYMAEMQSRYSEKEMSLFTPRSMVAIAARAAGIEAIDTPYVQVYDTEGLKRFATQGRDLGMSGMLVMTPRQIDVVRDAYSPTPEEVDVGKKIVQAADDAQKEGKGIVVVDGNFVSPPTLKQSHKLLKRYEAIKKLESLAKK
ncbi:MAG: CoA ester lyase [Desulfuromonas sp.]|nr:MAG: CoA ester lyase [Desulfuromonas sp.]